MLKSIILCLSLIQLSISYSQFYPISKAEKNDLDKILNSQEDKFQSLIFSENKRVENIEGTYKNAFTVLSYQSEERFYELISKLDDNYYLLIGFSNNSSFKFTDLSNQNHQLKFSDFSSNSDNIGVIESADLEYFKFIKNSFINSNNISYNSSIEPEPNSQIYHVQNDDLTKTNLNQYAVISDSKSNNDLNEITKNQTNQLDFSPTEIDTTFTKNGSVNDNYLLNDEESKSGTSINGQKNIIKTEPQSLNITNTNNVSEDPKVAENKTKTDVSSKNTSNSKWRTDIIVTDEQRENMSKGFYIVNEGETLYRVSVNTKVSLDKLKQLNNLKSNNVYSGTKLIISEEASFKNTSNNKWRTDITVSEEQRENMSKGYYIVNEGETLYRVSINTKVPIDQLKKLNNLKSNNIYPGSKLLITKDIVSKEIKPTTKWRTDIPVTEEQRENMSKGYYIVNEGETLYRVSINTKVPIDQLKKLNNLKSNNIYPGSKLIIK